MVFPLICFSQVIITGKVLNATDGAPVANASVFLSNATVGGKTGDDGLFRLNNVKPGQYEFVVSIIGYETYRQTLMVNHANITMADIKILVKTNQLTEVKVQANTDWYRLLEAFKNDFLGQSEAAKQCTILNPEMLDIDYDAASRKLTATSYDFLDIENKYLGYKIKYLLTKFEKDSRSGLLYFEGSALFEDMAGSPSQKNKWRKRRRETYEGSSMQFLRSLIVDSTDARGFIVYRVIRKPNPAYKSILDDKYIQTLIRKPLQRPEYMMLTTEKVVFALGFADCLYITYKPRKVPATILTIDGDYVLFDNNGIIINPAAAITEGYWGFNRMAELLPVDYEPPVSK